MKWTDIEIGELRPTAVAALTDEEKKGKYFVEPGVYVREDEEGLLKPLGIEVGDIIKTVNGQFITRDVWEKFQSVPSHYRLVVQRGVMFFIVEFNQS